MARRMTARQRAALRKAQLASARKRRKGKRINRKISRVQSRTNKRVAKHSRTFQRNLYTHSQHGGVYTTGRGVKAYKRAVKAQTKGQRKVKALKSKRRKYTG